MATLLAHAPSYQKWSTEAEENCKKCHSGTTKPREALMEKLQSRNLLKLQTGMKPLFISNFSHAQTMYSLKQEHLNLAKI